MKKTEAWIKVYRNFKKEFIYEVIVRVYELVYSVYVDKEKKFHLYDESFDGEFINLSNGDVVDKELFWKDYEYYQNNNLSKQELKDFIYRRFDGELTIKRVPKGFKLIDIFKF